MSDARNSSQVVQPWKVLLTAFLALGIVSALCYFGWVLANGDVKAFVLSTTVIIMGVALGWLFGIFISPIGEEKDDFSKYGKAVSVFFSGYLVAKIDPVITQILSAGNLLTDLVGFRLLSFVTSFVVAMLIAFGWRKYL
jgi:hypothetical protein